MLSPSQLLFFAAAWTLATAHTVIVYPGWRGDNLDTTSFVDQTQGLGVDYQNGSLVYPYGKQWIYPCESDSTLEAIGNSRALLNIPFSRRWHATNHEPYKMAHDWRCRSTPARLVCRSLKCVFLHQPRSGNDPTQHVASYGACLQHWWTNERDV